MALAQKSFFLVCVGFTLAGFIGSGCGKSYCKQYTEKFCRAQDAQGSTVGTTPSAPATRAQDAQGSTVGTTPSAPATRAQDAQGSTVGDKAAETPECAQTKAKVKDWSSQQCRLALRGYELEEQSKQMDKILEDSK